MKVLAIDPGVTSAYVLINVDPLAVEWASVWKDIDALYRLYTNGLFNKPDVIVIEDYRVYPNRARSHIGASLYTVRVIGHIEWIAFVQGIELVKQPASQAKQRWPDKRMGQIMFSTHMADIDRPTPITPLNFRSAHIRDAFRHALTYLEKNNVVRLPTKGRRIS